MSELDNMLEGEDKTEDDAPETETAEAEESENDDDAESGEEEGDKVPEEPEAAKAEGEEKPKKPREQRSVPLAAFLEVQNKLKAELEAKDAKLSELEAKSKQAPDFSKFFKTPPEKTPSVYDDEEGFIDASRQHMAADSFNTRFGISANFALKQHGQDKVNAALSEFDAASQNNPLMKQAIENSFDPVGEIVSWSETQNTLRTIQDAGGLEAYEKALRAKIEEELKAKQPKTEAKAEDDDDDQPVKAKPNLPGNFNKGPKGGNKNASHHQTLDELLN